jgi:hypothetical protein
MAQPLDISSAKGGRAITLGTAFDPCRAIHVNVGGDASVVWNDGSTSTVKNLIAGQPYPYSWIKVNVAGTTGTIELVALY